MCAQAGIDVLGGELAVAVPVVGPRAPVADHLLVVIGDSILLIAILHGQTSAK